MIDKAENDFYDSNDCDKTIAAFSHLIPFPSRFQNDTQVAYFGFQANYILFYCIVPSFLLSLPLTHSFLLGNFFITTRR